MLTSIVSAVVIFAVLIIVHEAGHFLVAKRVGVRVIRFSVGYPPKLFGIRRGQTEYALSATPLGGYVRMLGDEVAEDPNNETLEGYLREVQADLLEAMRRHGSVAACDSNPDDALLMLARRLALKPAPAESPEAILGRPLRRDEALLLEEVERRGSVGAAVKALVETRPAAMMACFRAQAFPTQSLSRRALIVLAGPLANILFAPLLMAVVYVYGVPYLMPIVGEVRHGMPAYVAGLRTGDMVLSVDGRKVESWADLSDIIKQSNGARLRLDIRRPSPNGPASELSVFVTPIQQKEETIYGNKATVWIIGVMPHGDEGVRHFGPIAAIGQSLVATSQLSWQLIKGVAMVVNGTTPAREALGGPIMIAKLAGKEARQGFADVAGFTVMLSLELGIINLLPVPLLDGGHLFFFLLEGLRGKPLQLRHREFAMQVGLLLLVALMTFVIVNDISHIMHS
jgi:regulator of sigma E protease